MALASSPVLLILHLLCKNPNSNSLSSSSVIGMVLASAYSIGSGLLSLLRFRDCRVGKFPHFEVMAPLVTVPLAWMFLDERLNSVQIFGGACVLITTIVIAGNESKLNSTVKTTVAVR